MNQPLLVLVGNPNAVSELDLPRIRFGTDGVGAGRH